MGNNTQKIREKVEKSEKIRPKVGEYAHTP
jgi:hypothetical protein